MDKTNFECGEMGTLNVNLFNAGKKDQTNVIAILENTELGLSLRSEAPFELKKFDKNGNSATQMFTFTIPFGAKVFDTIKEYEERQNMVQIKNQ